MDPRLGRGGGAPGSNPSCRRVGGWADVLPLFILLWGGAPFPHSCSFPVPPPVFSSAANSAFCLALQSLGEGGEEPILAWTLTL